MVLNDLVDSFYYTIWKCGTERVNVTVRVSVVCVGLLGLMANCWWSTSPTDRVRHSVWQRACRMSDRTPDSAWPTLWGSTRHFDNFKTLFRAPDPTQLNSTGSWVELSCKSVQIASGALNTLTTQLNSTENVQNCNNSQTSWVELSRVVKSIQSARPDSTQPVQLSWVGSGALSRA